MFQWHQFLSALPAVIASCLSIWLAITAFIKIELIALSAKVAVTYAITAPTIALLQQVKGERPLIQAMMLRLKKDATAMLTAIDRVRKIIIKDSFPPLACDGSRCSQF